LDEVAKDDLLVRTERVLDPNGWPTYHGFWRGMTEITGANSITEGLGFGGEQGIAGAVPGHVTTHSASVWDHARTLFGRQKAGPHGWQSVGSFHEIVGSGDDDDLYPGTFLFFSSVATTTARGLLTYTLIDRTRDLRVDDGCVEVADLGDKMRVTTTKSLYVSGDRGYVEVSGVVAEYAAAIGWGTETAKLVAGAVHAE